MPGDASDFNRILSRELGLADVLRARLMAGLFSLGAVSGVLLATSIPIEAFRPGYGRSWVVMLCVAGAVAAVMELAFARLIQLALQQDRTPSRWAGWASVAAESLLSTLVLATVALVLNESDPLASPFALLYGVTIATTPLRLDPRLSLFAGLASGGSYLILAAALLGVGYIDAPSDSGLLTFGARSFYMLMTGGAAAFVALQLRLRFVHSAESLEQRNWVVGVFGRYLSDDIVDVLLNDPQGLRLGGVKGDVTLLMSDLRGFSNLSEGMDPQQVVRLLNHYLGAMTEVIARNGGTIDEFIGDAILVIWNAPLPQPDHPAQAVRCAIEMQREMVAVNAWNKERGLPEIEMGIGVHSGDVIVGNIGSPQRQKYGVVGAAVNLTARVESYTVGGEVLITAGAAARIGDRLSTRGARDVYPKGSTALVRLLEVSGLEDLRLPMHISTLREIRSIAVGVRPLLGKELPPDTFPGRLAAISKDEAILFCEHPLQLWQNLALELGEGQAFAKVMAVGDRYSLRFTGLDPQATAARDAALL